MRYILCLLSVFAMTTMVYAGPLMDKLNDAKGFIIGGGVPLLLILFYIVLARKLLNAITELLADIKAISHKVQNGKPVSNQDISQLIENADIVTELVADGAAKLGAIKAAKKLRDLIKTKE